jgi:nucleotide-binding universal stress UspA family protein
MFKHVLIPTDGSELAEEAVEKGLAFARSAGAKVTFVTVAEPFHIFSGETAQLESTRAEYERHASEHAKAILARAEAKAAAAGVPAGTVELADDHPYDAIIRAAERAGCDLIAMASHGRRGLSAVVLGSQTVKVLTHTRIPVLVFR